MPPSKPTGRPASGAPGVKMLLTAASFVATLGGWAVLSNAENKTTSTATPLPEPAQTSNTVSIKLAPLPTLVPPPDPKSLVIKAQPVIIQVNNRPAVAAAPAPQIAGLRIVNAPSAASGGSASVAGAPPPATTTGSSKP